MIEILLVVACGKMGRTVAAYAAEDKEIHILCGLDKAEANLDFPVYHSLSDIRTMPDAVIDFSHPSMLNELLAFGKEHKIPLVLAATGYTDEQIAQINAAAKEIPIFFTFNMSIGINLLCALAKTAASVLGDAFDIEIVEKHHNQKIDAPSGTAIMLANAVNEEFDDTKHYEYDRHSRRQKREKSEIGIHSIRGGTIVGEHDVIFAGQDEVITLSHSAGSKGVFAAGALKAAKFICEKSAGIYDMRDAVNS